MADPAGSDDRDATTDETGTQAKAAPAERRFNPKVVIGLLILSVVVVAAVGGTFYFVEQERKRDLQGWQVRLGIVADSRAAAVNDWVEQNFASIRELAHNASLQVYMSTLVSQAQDTGDTGTPPAAETDALPSPFGDDENGMFGDTDSPDAESDAGTELEAGYLRNLLVATADRTGFHSPEPTGEVAANIEVLGVAGIGLVDAEGQAIVSTPDMPPMSKRIRTAVAEALEGEPALIDAYLGPTGKPTVGFVLPVYGIQDDGSGARAIGAVVGIRTIGDDLWDRLAQPGETAATAETYLVRRTNGTVEYLSPLGDGTGPLERTLAADTPDLAAAFAIDKPGGFGIRMDYSGTRVLAVSRSLPLVPWTLVRKINRDEALAETDRRLGIMLGVFGGLIVIVVLAILFVWKKGASARATQALADAELALERFQNMTKFMRVVTDSQPTRIVAVDGDTLYTFANKPAADAAGMKPEDMMGKTMAAVMGPLKAQAYAEINKNVLKNFERESHLHFFGEDSGDADVDDFQVIKSDHIPLRGDRDHPPGVLMVLDDLTELTRERRRNEQMLRELINTLVSVVDRRDPYSAHHSNHVAEVAREIAREMGLGDAEIKTVDIAGSLMNLGKIYIPPELLTKTGNLSPEERSLVANSYLVSVDLLEGVTFDGPVVETIRQMGETWDGRGPLGLKEEEILVTARILAVANAFVGMISPRAYREAMTFEKVSEILLSDVGSKFDRKPVMALINFLENRDGKMRWAHFREKPTDGDGGDSGEHVPFGPEGRDSGDSETGAEAETSPAEPDTAGGSSAPLGRHDLEDA